MTKQPADVLGAELNPLYEHCVQRLYYSPSGICEELLHRDPLAATRDVNVDGSQP